MNIIYNIGKDYYALLTSSTNVDFLLPIKIIILEKKTLYNKTLYKVKIKDILEKDFNYVKEQIASMRVNISLKSDGRTTLIKKTKLDKISNFNELISTLNDITFYIEDNYITTDKESLKDLYSRFTKYLINFHISKMYQLMSRTFISNTPIFENQKDMFKKRIEKIGFGDMFDKWNLNVKI